MRIRKEFRHGPLGVYDFDDDHEIEVEIEGCTSIYLSRPTVIKLRDWLTEQINRSE